MNNDRLCQVLLSPRVTEKSTRVGEDGNQYVFHVINDASKQEVKGAVEMLFEVNVESVRIVNVKGKSKAFRMRAGKRSDWKKAYVVLKEGQDIDFADDPGFSKAYVLQGEDEAAVRELLGTGDLTIWEKPIDIFGPSFQPFSFMVEAPGAFVALGLMLCLMNLVGKK